MDPELAAQASGSETAAERRARSCDSCGSTAVSITPVPGHWLQYSCDDCDHWWWETEDGKPIQPSGT